VFYYLIKYADSMEKRFVKLFLRFALSAGFLSAVADRFGLWSKDISVWGNWDKFLEYTAQLNPWFPDSWIPLMGMGATAAEIVLGIGLFIGFKTEIAAKLSGLLLLVFALSMAFSISFKAPLDYSVFAASAGAFALGLMKEKYMELDMVIFKSHKDKTQI